MKIISNLLSTGCVISLLASKARAQQGSLRATRSRPSIQGFQSLLKANSTVPFDKEGLDHRKLAVCSSDDLGGTLPRYLEGWDAPISSQGARFGHVVSMSNDGRRVAFSYPLYDRGAGGEDHGGFELWERECGGESWNLLGTPLLGIDPEDAFGWGLALSGDGKRVAVGIPNAGDTNSGAVVVFEYNEVAKSWALVGSPIEEDEEEDHAFLGSSIAINEDGSRIAVGLQGSDRVRVYDYSGGGWKKLGSDILGDDDEAADSHCGKSVSLSSDGNRAVMGCPEYSSSGKTSRGRMQAYEWSNGIWKLLVSVAGVNASAKQGYAVSISGDGKRIATGAPYVDVVSIGTYLDAGRVSILEEGEDGTWANVDDFFGNNADTYGFSVDLSADGNTLVVGAPEASQFAGTKNGMIFVLHRSSNGNWKRDTQSITENKNGQAGYDVAVSAKGDFLAYGSPFADEVRVWAWDDE